MYPHQYYLLVNLRDLFEKLKYEKKITGYLEAETGIFFLENIHRRPDISYFTLEQVTMMANGELPTPEFVIEVVSTNDVLPKQNLKMKNYREAGIKVVWEIFPETEEVHVTRGETTTICTGEKICSAAPTLPEFKIAAKAIFKKPLKQ